MNPNLQTATSHTYSPEFENTPRGIEACDLRTHREQNNASPLPAGEGQGEGNRDLRKPTQHRIGLSHNQCKYFPFSILIALTLLSFSAPASTITGNLKDLTGANYSTNLLFTPQSTPLVRGSALITSKATNVIAASDGSFSLPLVAGDYLVNLGGLRRDSFLIQVPDDSLSYNISTLIRSTLSYNYPQSPIYEEKTRRGQANGYAALDASAHVPASQLGPNAQAGYVLGTDGSIASWRAGAGYAFNTGQFAVVSTTNIAIGSGSMLTNPHAWSLFNTHAFTNAGKIVTAFPNNSLLDGASTADMTVITNAHLVLENTSGDQTKLLFTYAGGPRGGFHSDLSGNLNWHTYGGGCHQFWNSLDSSTPVMVLRGGTVGIGISPGSLPNEMLEIANGAVLMNAISAPSALSGGAKLYARENSGTTEMFVLDDAGNETQISPHAMDGPNWLYDPDDPFPHVVRESNQYVGIVRYTNLSRQAALVQKLLLGIDVSSLAPEQRTVSFLETFQEHNLRLPAESPFVLRSWPKPAAPDPGAGTNVPPTRAIKPVPQWLKDRGVN